MVHCPRCSKSRLEYDCRLNDMTNNTAVLLIHGLGGTQYDLGSLDRVLTKQGFHTHTPLLTGHGTVPEDLNEVVVEDWLSMVEQAYQDLEKQYQTVHLIGICMGALLAIELVKQHRHTAGALILLSPSIHLDGWALPWHRFLRYPVYRLPYLPKRIRVYEEEPFGLKNERLRSVIKTKFQRGESFHYPWIPLSSLRQFDRLRRWAKKDLHQINRPTLVIHAREDELTSPRSAYLIANQLNRNVEKPLVQVIILENSYHMICNDNDRKSVADSILNFLHQFHQPHSID